MAELRAVQGTLGYFADSDAAEAAAAEEEEEQFKAACAASLQQEPGWRAAESSQFGLGEGDEGDEGDEDLRRAMAASLLTYERDRGPR